MQKRKWKENYHYYLFEPEKKSTFHWCKTNLNFFFITCNKKKKMSEFQIVAIMLFLAILILIIVMTVCRFIGLWTWTTTWIFSSKEEKLNLTRSKGYYNANGYFVSFPHYAPHHPPSRLPLSAFFFKTNSIWIVFFFFLWRLRFHRILWVILIFATAEVSKDSIPSITIIK